jgi:4a-hydroxytetrahydrobiopterin dehydratase
MAVSENGPLPLAAQSCVPCRAGAPALEPGRRDELLRQLSGEWRVVDGQRLERVFLFRNFRAAIRFANAVGDIAEQQGHHPELLVGWGRVKVSLFTHVIGGLHENDFILAARIDALPPAAAGAEAPARS